MPGRRRSAAPAGASPGRGGLRRGAPDEPGRPHRGAAPEGGPERPPADHRLHPCRSLPASRSEATLARPVQPLEFRDVTDRIVRSPKARITPRGSRRSPTVTGEPRRGAPSRPALERGHGRMAQFDHPELGGMASGASGGMTMVGRMFDDALRARWRPCAANSPPSCAGGGFRLALHRGAPGRRGRLVAGGPRTPVLHRLAGRDALRLFPETRRLAIEEGSGVAVYDTGEHHISGVSQSNGELRFTGPSGAARGRAPAQDRCGGGSRDARRARTGAGGSAAAPAPSPRPAPRPAP